MCTFNVILFSCGHRSEDYTFCEQLQKLPSGSCEIVDIARFEPEPCTSCKAQQIRQDAAPHMTDMANLGPALPQNTAGVSTSDNYTNKDSVFIIARDYYPACGHCANYEPTGCRREPSAPQFFTIERAGQCEACLKNTSHQSGTWGQFVESVSKQSGALDHAGGQVSTGQSQIGVQYLQEADGPREYRVSVPGSDNRYAAAGTGDKGEGPSERVTRKQFWMEEDDLLKPVENESKWPITLEYRIDETARKSKEKYGP